MGKYALILALSLFVAGQFAKADDAATKPAGQTEEVKAQGAADAKAPVADTTKDAAATKTAAKKKKKPKH